MRADRGRVQAAREDERQHVAAHLHDSVLQTLALVQRQAHDPAAVTRLARRQEHDLRAWMAGEAALGAETLASALRDAVAEVEDEHGDPDRAERARRPAARPSLPRRSRPPRARRCATPRATPPARPCSCSPSSAATRAEVFVRDEGPGFELAEVPTERRGVRDAIIGRMAAVGGSATVESAAGEGTEVALRIGAQRAMSGPAANRRRRRPPPVPRRRARRARAHHDVVGEAAAPAEAIAVVAEARPDVLLLDVHLPDGGGVAVLEALAATPPDARPRVLAVSVSDAAEDVVPMIRAGALGYVTKTIDTAELLTAIATVARGEASFSPRLAAFVLEAFSKPPPDELQALTQREREVLHHLARGYSYKRIGLRLGISARTVETHVGAVLRKLQLSSRHEVSHWAARRGLLGDDG